jgi:hypothetical protein
MRVCVQDGDCLARALRTHEQLNSVARVCFAAGLVNLVTVHEQALLVSTFRATLASQDQAFDVLLELPSKRFAAGDRPLELRQEGRGLRLAVDDEADPDLLFVPAVFDPYGVLDRMSMSQTRTRSLRLWLAASELLRAISSLAGTASTFDAQVSGNRVAFSARGELTTVAIEFATLEYQEEFDCGDDRVSYAYSYSLAQLRAVSKDVLSSVERAELTLAPEGLLRIRGARLPHFSQVCALLPV